MRRAWPMLWLFVACAEPASLRVDVETREPTVERARLRVQSDTVQLDCVLSEAPSEDACSFEAASEVWTKGSPFSFLLYGDPGTSIEVEVLGLDAAGLVTSSARADDVLPDAAGARETIVLELKARTEVHRSCEAQLVAMSTVEGRDAVGTIDVDGDGLLEIVLVTGDSTSVVRFTPEEPDCLSVTRGPNLGCELRPTDLAVGDVLPDAAGQEEVVAICANIDNSGPRPVINSQIRVAQLTDENLGAVDFSRRTLPVPLERVSNPVLADLDGDGIDEVAVLHAKPELDTTSRARLFLLIWKPGPDEVFSIPLEETDSATAIRVVGFGPLVLPIGSQGKDALIVAGYLDRAFVKREWDASLVALTEGVAVGASPIGPSMTTRPGDDGALDAVLVSVFSARLPAGDRNTLRFIQVGAGDPRELNWAYPLPPALDLADQPLNIRIAVGDVHGAEERSAVIANDGNAFIFPVAPNREATVLQITDQPVDATMRVLLANLDGRPGSEIIAFNPDVARIDAIDANGNTPTGWPLTAGGEGADNRAIIEDLDRDGRAEIIVFSFGRIQVFSLGPRSYDPDATPWPYPLRDQRLTASNLNEKAPN